MLLSTKQFTVCILENVRFVVNDDVSFKLNKELNDFIETIQILLRFNVLVDLELK